MPNVANEAFTKYDDQIFAQEKIVRAEMEKLASLHQARPTTIVQDYKFQTPEQSVKLSELFGDKSELILIHNMGKSCSYCTLWADGLIGFAPHFEDRAAFVLVNNDKPVDQAAFAASRGWKFKIVSAAGTEFSSDMGFKDKKKETWEAGVSVFTKDADGTIRHKTRAGFGPGDLFCSAWNFLELLPGGVGDWSPKLKYQTNQAEPFRFSSNIALYVKNVDQAVSFYRDTLGFSIGTLPTNLAEGVPMKKGSMTFWLDDASANPSEKVGQALFEFVVPELEAGIATLRTKGCETLEATAGAAFKGQMMADPFGMRFHLYQPINQ